nr:TNT domain-containing protein [Streptococcus suis]
MLDSAGNPITEPANLKAGQFIDRYGNSGGRFTSPLENGQKLPFETRGLPYHKYEVVKDINMENILKAYNQSPKIIQDKVSVEMKKWNLSFDDLANIRKGEIARVFGQGGGTQIQFGTSVSIYELLGLIKEVL